MSELMKESSSTHHPHHHWPHRMVYPVHEPYVFHQLKHLMGHHVKVVTKCCEVTGKLRRVYPDSICVKKGHHEYIIRLKTVCYVLPVVDP